MRRKQNQRKPTRAYEKQQVLQSMLCGTVQSREEKSEGTTKGVYEVVVKEDERLLEASGCKRILNSEDYLFNYLYIFKNSNNLI